MVDVLESSCNWKFVDQEDRWCLVKNITTTLGNIVYYTYGIGGTLEIKETKEKPDPKEAKDSIIQPLKPAAGYIIETFLSAKSGTLRFQPLLRTFVDGFYSSKSTLPRTSLELGAGSVKSVLMFTKSLLHASTLLEKPTSQLESQLFKASPVVARLYAVHENYRDLIISVFEALIANASSGVGEPPSLLGHLGSLTSRNFLGVLSDLDNPLPHDDNVISVWQFLSTVVISRQNWFANYLLTGKTPRDALKKQNSESTAPSPHRSLLSHALETLSRIQQISIPQALAMLEFVSLAQNHFPWTLYDLQKHASFIKGITEFVGTLPPPQVSAKSEARIETCYKAQMAAYIAEILAMHLFHSRQMGNTAPVKELLPNLSYYTRFAVAIPDYNASLHGNLKRNFESRYPGCNLQEFQRTRMEHRGFGRDYFYDLPLADKMLSFDGAWTGRKNDGYGNELATANINMSLVDAQISVLKSWKVLAVELSSNLQVDIEVQKMTTKVVRDCLSSNIRSQFSEDIFIRLNQTRADLALVLLQRLIEAKSTVPELYSDNGRFGQGILALVWEAAGRMGRTFGLALTTGDATYYRTLLKLLFLALRIHADAKIPELDPRRSTRIGQQQTNEVVPLILEILDGVVANGFRDLAAALHDQPDEFFPEDIGLITGILQTCLRIPGVEFVHAQIVSMIAANNTARVATTLFSWSDKLAISGDPIYGELSIFFLLELSTMPAMAEYLAIEGILGQISSASITTYLRRGNVSPFADGAGPQRCYNIWVRGILPLLLNVLDAVGASVATEISLFLSQFPNLLSQSATAFDAPDTSRTATKAPPKYMTLSVVSEVHSLSLIFFILDSFRMQQVGITEIPEIQWDIAGVLENVDFWLSTRGVLRERILPMGKRELEMSKTKVEKSKIGATTRLEEAVVMELTGIRDVLSGGEA
ncbi:Nucleoporin NUP188 [Phlyctema vagabunda]|uniref:Nucleoporin NUP188 n=1 Tax=Phlyctema vagabunda TaxID=108571 RepID=A0ABR4PXZ6_9HELO